MSELGTSLLLGSPIKDYGLIIGSNLGCIFIATNALHEPQPRSPQYCCSDGELIVLEIDVTALLAGHRNARVGTVSKPDI